LADKVKEMAIFGPKDSGGNKDRIKIDENNKFVSRLILKQEVEAAKERIRAKKEQIAERSLMAQ